MASLNIADVVELPASKEGFKMQEQMKITWCQVWAVGRMIKLFPAKCRDEIHMWQDSLFS